MGDMNIHLLKYGSHDMKDTYVDGIFSRGLLPRIFRAIIAKLVRAAM